MPDETKPVEHPKPQPRPHPAPHVRPHLSPEKIAAINTHLKAELPNVSESDLEIILTLLARLNSEG